jgi:hypothetical protein
LLLLGGGLGRRADGSQGRGEKFECCLEAGTNRNAFGVEKPLELRTVQNTDDRDGKNDGGDVISDPYFVDA